MPEIKEHIKTQSELIVKMFKEDGFNVHETISSIIEIDRFLDENTENDQPKKREDYLMEILKLSYFQLVLILAK